LRGLLELELPRRLPHPLFQLVDEPLALFRAQSW
jgi:hypothetical protein